MTEATRSTSVAAFGYDAETQQLHVRFRHADEAQVVSGIYHEVPVDLHRMLVNANTNGGSVGRTLNEHIKKAGFRYERADG